MTSLGGDQNKDAADTSTPQSGTAAAAEKGVDDLMMELVGDISNSKPKSKSSTAAATGDGVDDLMMELVGDSSTAKAKSKKKKKKKKGGAKPDVAGGAADGAVPSEATAPPEQGKKKKKESAAVRMMRERREKMLAEEERIRKEQEEEDARIMAEEARLAEVARKKEEDKIRKKAAEKAKRDRKRQEGTLLSKGEKERRRKAEAFRKQLLEKGMVPGTSKVDPQSSKQDRDTQNRKRRNQRDKSAEEEKSVEAVDSTTEQQGATEDPKDDVVAKDVPAPPPPVEDKIIPDAWDAEDVQVDNNEGDDKTDRTLKSKPSASSTKPVTSVGKEKIGAHPTEGDSRPAEESESEDDSEYEGMSKTEIASGKRLDVLRKQRAKQKETAKAARSPDRLRSPVVCILGHVDTGKTKILDKIRRTNVQDGEAGGITQQIGATYFPIDAVKKEATKLKEGRELIYNVPSLLIIDTPGHESFTNLRSRGSSLCDIAILVVDIMHGLEPQTRESINLLKLRKTPFIVALNKIDRIYDWKAQPNNCPSRDSLDKQLKHARDEFYRRVDETKLELAEIGFNTELYWKNDDVRKTVSLVPTSAITGEGIPDLLMLLLALPQKLLTERLMFNTILEATVLEVKVIEGLGTTVDIILTGGTMHEGDTIMVVGLDGPIVATIRALLTPHPMKEMRVKGQYLHHKKIEAAQGIKISADGMEKAVAGTQVMVVRDPNDVDEMEFVREEVMKDFQTILTNVDKSGIGVYVQASTLGSLEALLEFLKTSKIPVSGINIGPVHKRDVTKASTMLEKSKEFATILAFDVPVEREAKELAEDAGVRIFTADIIYHLFDQFNAYMDNIKRVRREEVNDDVVFPSISKILPQHVYNKKDPIVVGVDVMDGILRVGTPLVIKKNDGTWLDVGRVAGIELNKKAVITAKKGESVAVKIQHRSTEHIMYGRHFDFQDALVSKMSRNAIELLKENYRSDLEKDDWKLVIKLKEMLKII